MERGDRGFIQQKLLAGFQLSVAAVMKPAAVVMFLRTEPSVIYHSNLR